MYCILETKTRNNFIAIGGFFVCLWFFFWSCFFVLFWFLILMTSNAVPSLLGDSEITISSGSQRDDVENELSSSKVISNVIQWRLGARRRRKVK